MTTIDGTIGDDTIDGDANADVINGLQGNDLLSASSYNNTIHGNDGNDTILGSIYNDSLYGDAGNDFINDESGTNYLDGGDGDDKLYARGTSTLIGGDGNDQLWSDGQASMAGGAGDDEYYLWSIGGTIHENAGEGHDSVIITRAVTPNPINVVTYVLPDQVEDLRYTGIWQFDGTGNNLNNVIEGGSDTNTIHGLGGNDEIYGGRSSDQLSGDGGYDQIFGRAGDDQLFGGQGDDTLSGEGGDDTLTGGTGDDDIIGGVGTDTAEISGLRRDATVTTDGEDHFVTSVDGHDWIDGSTEIISFLDGKISYGIDTAAAEVNRIYLATLGREPDPIGLSSWTHSVEGGLSLQDTVKAFLECPEWQTKYGTLDNGDFVSALYNNVLGRAPDQSGYDYWKQSLDDGDIDRSQLVLNFSESNEFKDVTKDEAVSGLWTIDEDAAFVERAYKAGLDRDADQCGLTYWIEALKGGTCQLDIANAFASSSEFAEHYGNLTNEQFVEQMYLNALDRPGDAEGVAAWTAFLDAGASRGELVNAFANSHEMMVSAQHLIADGAFFV